MHIYSSPVKRRVASYPNQYPKQGLAAKSPLGWGEDTRSNNKQRSKPENSRRHERGISRNPREICNLTSGNTMEKRVSRVPLIRTRQELTKKACSSVLVTMSPDWRCPLWLNNLEVAVRLLLLYQKLRHQDTVPTATPNEGSASSKDSDFIMSSIRFYSPPYGRNTLKGRLNPPLFGEE